MKKIAAIFAVCAVLVAGLFMLFGNSSGQDTPKPEPSQSQSLSKVEISEEAPVELQAAEPAQPEDDNFPITKTRSGNGRVAILKNPFFWKKLIL